MLKRGGDPTHGGNLQIKKHKGVRTRAILVPDSDDETLPSSVTADYARLVKTRVNLSGNAGGITTTSIRLLEVGSAPKDLPPEVVVDGPVDAATDVVIPIIPATRKKRQKANDSTKMQSWIDLRLTILDEIISLDGPGEAQQDTCSSCLSHESTPLYRCLECSYGLLLCGDCVVESHQVLPLHRLERWEGGFFDRASLHSLGLTCHLEHGGAPCPMDSTPHELLVIDVNGWHKLRVQFCTCGKSTPWHERYRQLLRMRWYPASFNRPRTAFTWDLLETYHKLTLQGKLNLYDFYFAIMHKSDNQGRSKPVYRYHEISRCVRQWKHLKGIKRGGGAHQANPVSTTAAGSFAIECPACPHPGRNLPDGWDDANATSRWIYAQFVAVDANFRLKSKNRQIKDPELGSGWSYFVENTAYSQHVSGNSREEDVTSCGSEFHAVNNANSRGSKDYIASGVVKAVCARHCFVLPNAVGDLQRGERYINTDYIIAQYLKRCKVRDIKISYDIACKWSINLRTRFETYHEDVNLANLSLTYLVPKFHLPAHGPKCQVRYSFNYTRGVGRTHGETVEQEWAYINLAALSTREMGPGARHASLDDSWGGWNWRKTLGFGTSLEKNLSKAVEMSSKQRQIADDFTATFPRETIQAWSLMVKEWEADPSKPNPYFLTEKGSKVSEARLRLTEEEAAEAEKGITAPHKVSASVFVRMGLELEDQQYTLRIMAAERTRSDAQKATLLERRNALLHHIKKWRELQAIYMPGVFDTNAPDLESPQKEKAESVKLWLPSQLENTAERASLCAPNVIDSEKALRFGQLQDSLNELRRARRTRFGLIMFHKIQLAGEGQKTQTKSRAVVQTVQDRITKSVRRYRVAREALLQLERSDDWERSYLELTNADNRGPGKEREELGASDGEYFPSWIWRSTTAAVSQDEVNEDMRVEWAQCMARADRWEEEVTLLQEEMRRVVRFLGWRSRDWSSRVDVRASNTAPTVRSGISAYAKKQASVYLNLAVRFCQRWLSTLVSLSLPHSWATEFLATQDLSLVNPDTKDCQLEQQENNARFPATPHFKPPMTDTSATPFVSADAPAAPLISADTSTTPAISTNISTTPPISTRPQADNDIEYSSSDDSDGNGSGCYESDSEYIDE